MNAGRLPSSSLFAARVVRKPLLSAVPWDGLNWTVGRHMTTPTESLLILCSGAHPDPARNPTHTLQKLVAYSGVST